MITSCREVGQALLHLERDRVLGVTGFRVGVDSKLLEADFVKIAKRFGEKRAIGYGAWRDAGVCAQVLQRTGVARTKAERVVLAA